MDSSTERQQLREDAWAPTGMGKGGTCPPLEKLKCYRFNNSISEVSMIGLDALDIDY